MKFSSQKILLLLGFILYINNNNFFVVTETFQSSLGFEIEKKLQSINRPATKVIKTVHGDTYGCVDFHKQPAFDYSSMKNLLFQYEISSQKNLRTTNITYTRFGYLWENGIGCPVGTVPIKRVTKDELLRLNLFSDIYKPQGSWNFSYNQFNVANDNHHFAVCRTKGKRQRYNGASMIISTTNPKVHNKQFSSSRMHIQIGDDYIQVGLIVYPKLYSDSQTRNFVYTSVGGDSECYNNMCPAGITLVRSDFPLDMVRQPCNRGSLDRCIDTSYGVHKDTDGNWWLKFEGEDVGLWPGNRFKQSFANSVEWGGEVYTSYVLSPQMGYGYFPEKNIKFDAHIYNITTIDKKYRIDGWVKNTETFSDNGRGYNVIDDIHSSFPVRHVIYYGGPGDV